MFPTQFSTLDPDGYWSKRKDLLARLQSSVLLARNETPLWVKEFPLIDRFGPFEVRALPILPRAWIEGGPGKAEVISWEDEKIEVDVSGAAKESQLRLGLGYYDNWRDELGRQVDPFYFKGTALSSTLARNGRMVFRYHRPFIQWLGLVLSLTIGLCLLAAIFWERRPNIYAREMVHPADRKSPLLQV